MSLVQTQHISVTSRCPGRKIRPFLDILCFCQAVRLGHLSATMFFLTPNIYFLAAIQQFLIHH